MTPADLRAVLAAHAEAADRSPDWPAASWDAVRAAGALGWSVPPALGGDGLPAVELLRRSEAVAAGCLTTAFILSQREAAVRRLLKGPAHLQSRYLDPAAGEYLTVGLSQLTTSRRLGTNPLTATPTAGGYRLDGAVPWVTGADRAAAVVIGAALADGRQVVVAVPAGRAGLTVGPPLPLAALLGSRTAEVRCDGVAVGADEVLAGPAEQVLGPVGGGGLETSCLAVGLAAAAVEIIESEAAGRPAIGAAARALADATAAVRDRLHAAADGAADPDRALALRADTTRLALRAAQAAVLAARGSGFVTPHPAQRLARQALFFLVWSCPRPVADGVLADLLPE
jgi:alkylation response protein AidB-like acyl-CoA dehydrogenase